MTDRHLIGMLLALGLALSACGGTTTPGAPPTSTSTPSTPEDPVETTTPDPTTPEPTSPDGTGGPALPPAVTERADVQAAIIAEAQRAGVEPAAVAIVSYEEVTWTDGSIGCPQPGVMYTQALVPGHRLVLAVDGQEAHYHQARDRDFSYCASPSGTGSVSPTT